MGGELDQDHRDDRPILHFILASHLSEGEHTLVHRLVQLKEKQRNDFNTDSIRRSLLFDRDGVSTTPQPTNMLPDFRTTASFIDTNVEISALDTTGVLTDEKVRGLMKLNFISEDLYGDLKRISEENRRPYRETGKQFYNNSNTPGGAETVTHQIVNYIDRKSTPSEVSTIISHPEVSQM